MLKNLMLIDGRFSIIKLCVTLIFITGICYAQQKPLSNLQVFYSLADSLANQIILTLPQEEKSVYLQLNLGENYSLFKGQIKSSFKKSGINIFEVIPQEINVPFVNITMEGAGVEYGEIFRDGWFGSHYTTRSAIIFGNYSQSFSNYDKQEFEIVAIDTVKVEDVNELENSNFPFTQGNLPPELFLSGLAEPLIAIGTVAAVVILFFSIRSK